MPVPARIATFDNDGTLIVEQPMYFQIQFAEDRIRAMLPANPAWNTTEPFATLLSATAPRRPRSATRASPR